jgi:uncharacterized protein with FMN-binding domain
VYVAFLRLDNKQTNTAPIAIVSKTTQLAGTGEVALNNKIPAAEPPIIHIDLTKPDSTNTPMVPPPANLPAPAAKPTPPPVKTRPPTPVPPPAPAPKPKGKFNDGTYTGPSIDAYYGNIQVAAVISGGKLTDVQILDYPQDRRTSQNINSQALPILVSEAISAQSANIDAVSGASESSPAFISSLSAALAQAAN